MPIGLFVDENVVGGEKVHRVYRRYEQERAEVYAVRGGSSIHIRDYEDGRHKGSGHQVTFSREALPHLIEILQSFLPATPTVGSDG